MATVNRPPFWVPRPSDDFVWSRPSEWMNSGAITVTRTQVKIFGQPGQSPPFRPNFTLDDPPMWQGSPLNSGAIMATKTQLKVFGQPGQVPPFRPNFTYDDPPMWQGAPLNSGAIMATKTQVKVFGQPGQSPPFRAKFTYDDAAPWQATVERNLSLLFPTHNPFSNRAWQWSDDASGWQGNPVGSHVIPLLTQQKVFGAGGQVPPFRPNFTYDDPSYWSGEPLSSAAIPLLTQQKIFGQGGQVPPFRWNWGYDDPPSWQPWIAANINLSSHAPFSNRQWQWSDDASGWLGEPVSSALIPLLTQQKLFGAGGQVQPFRWNYTIDDPPPWQWPLYERNPNVLIPSAEPFNNYKTYWYSEDSFWQGAPLSSGAITVTRTQVTVFGQPGQVPPFRPNFTYDDPPMWQGGPLKASIIQLLTFGGQPFLNRWRYEYDDASGWQGTPIFAAALTLPVQQNPFSNRQTYWYSEDPWWTGRPVASAAITLTTTQVKIFGQPGQAPPFRWNFTLDDPPMWPGPVPRGSAVMQLPATGRVLNLYGPFNWTYTVDVPPMWQGVPLSFNYLLTQPSPPAKPSGIDWIDFYRRARRR